MSKSRLWVGITIIVFGTALVFTNLLVGIKDTVRDSFSRALVFPVSFERLIAHTTPGFSLAPGEKVSVWLRMPDRSVENKDFTFALTVINGAGEMVKEMAEDFRAGYFRSSYGRGQFYRIGVLKSAVPLNGVMIYQTTGTWVPEPGGELVLRQERKVAVALPVVFGLMVGVTLVILGVMRLSLKDPEK